MQNLLSYLVQIMQKLGWVAHQLDILCNKWGEKNSTRIICMNPQYNDTMIGNSDEWIPIAPGTDAALIAGMAYVMIKEKFIW